MSIWNRTLGVAEPNLLARPGRSGRDDCIKRVARTLQRIIRRRNTSASAGDVQ